MTYQPADPRARRRALRLFCALVTAAIVIAGLLQYNERLLEAWLVANFYARSTHLILVTITVLTGTLPLTIFSSWLYRVGNRAVHHQRFPPPDTAVIRDTVVYEGVAAQRRGLGLKILAVLLATGALFVPIALWFILQSI